MIMSANTGWYLCNFRASTIRALIENGIEVLAVCPHDECTRALEELGARHQAVTLSRGGTNPITECRAVASFLMTFMKERPDAVLSFTPKPNIYAGLAAAMLGIPVINNISGVGYLFGRRTLTALILGFLYRISLRPSFTVFFQNAEDLRRFHSRGYVAREQARRLWGSGVPLDQFSYCPRPPDGVVRCLFVGRLLRDKGIEHFVEAATILRKESDAFAFSVLGPLDPENPSGITSETLETWIRKGDVEYLGVTDEVHRVLPHYDLVILPSLYGEGMPRSLLEAAAAGKIIVTSDHPGCRDAVSHESGLLLEDVSAAGIVGALRRFSSLSPDERASMARAARRLAEDRFSEEANIAEYLRALGRAVPGIVPRGFRHE